MGTEITVALIAFIGTAVGTSGGIMVANKLTNYRIEQLEKKMDKHNTLIERMVLVEQKDCRQDSEIAEIRKEMQRLRDGRSYNED